MAEDLRKLCKAVENLKRNSGEHSKTLKTEKLQKSAESLEKSGGKFVGKF